MEAIKKQCCGQERTTAFCPECGMRLTDNPFIGQTKNALEAEVDGIKDDQKHTETSLRDLEKAQADALQPVKLRYQQACKKGQWMLEAIRSRITRLAHKKDLRADRL